MPPPVSAPGIDPVSASIAGVQAALGIVQTISGDARAKKARAKRTAYQTPEEIYKLMNLTLSGGQGDTIARDSQTGQLDRAFSQILGGATRLGADANDLSALFDQKIQGIMRIGDKFHESNMEAMSKILTAYDTVASNKAAEWSSAQDMLKDDIQGGVLDKRDGVQNIGSAFNSFISLQGASKTSDLYKFDPITGKKLA
ncbi:MAG: hypothetical protein KA968_13445 [Chitinophagaceae bacterium]|nr:hypothetical protein [Chitinophagaceae bacterium]